MVRARALRLIGSLSVWRRTWSNYEGKMAYILQFLKFDILFVFLLFWLRCQSDLLLQPTSKVVLEGSTVKFYCTLEGDFNPPPVTWSFNTSEVQPKPNGRWKTYIYRSAWVIDFSNTSLDHNNTRLQCHIPDRNLTSNSAVLLVESVPGPVRDLKLSYYSDHISITWTEPFSQLTSSTTGKDWEIQYCVLIVQTKGLGRGQSTCNIVNRVFRIPRPYFQYITYVWVTPINSVGRGPTSVLRFPDAAVRPTEVLVYAGTNVDFQCNYTGVGDTAILKWLSNFTLLDENKFKQRLVVGEGSVVRRLRLLSSYDYGHIQCVLIHQYSYNTYSRAVAMNVQGKLQVHTIHLKVHNNTLKISWPEPFTYVIPPNTKENITYCVQVLKEWSRSTGEDQCNLTRRVVVQPVQYEQTYGIVLHAVNAVGRGIPTTASLMATDVLYNCSASHPYNDERYVETSCSFNESVLGYIAILDYRSKTIVSNSTKAGDSPIILKGHRNGFHSILVFPLLKASNLVGRRLAFRERIRISNILHEAGQVGYGNEGAKEAGTSPHPNKHLLISWNLFHAHMDLYVMFGIIGLIAGVICGALIGLALVASIYKWFRRKAQI